MNRIVQCVAARTVAVVLSLVCATALAAQTTTGSIRGYVRGDNGVPIPNASVSARNIATSATRVASSNENGYFALVGLAPGDYDVTARRLGAEPQTRRQRVQIGETITLNFDLTAIATQLAAVQVTAPRETQSSEVATNVSAEQISALPSTDRNFLALAQLAPGVRITGGRSEATTKSFTAGALPAQNINVFIDGASYKSDVLPSGVVGQESSRGNPFPQIAVQEFRVLTNNYKAEYQKASSAIITATTKSGTNDWRGSALYTGQTKGLQALDEFQRRAKRSVESQGGDFNVPDYRRDQFALSMGGPVIQDKLFFFGAYEGNYQDRSNIVTFGSGAAQFPTVFGGKDGFFVSPFRSNLGIAKLNYTQNQNHSWELSYNLRTETDIRGFGGQTSFESAENVKIDVNTFLLKHTMVSGNVLNEAMVSYQDSKWNPVPENANLLGFDYQGIGRVGGRDSYQKFDQKRLSFRNDLTWSGLTVGGSHVIKVGANFDANDYDVQKFFNGNPLFVFRAAENYAFPFEARYGFGDPNMNTTNNQIGVYAQDDWTPTPRLTLNLGIRWDYESDMFNNSYVTPALVRSELGPLFPSSYFTDGNDRPGFKKAFQPRVGFNYAFDEDARTSLFGAFGVYYDRSNYNNGLDEKFRLQYQVLTYRFSADGLPRDGQPTIQWNSSYLSKEGLDALANSPQRPLPEAFLIDNNTKPPRSNMFSLGLRHARENVVASVTYTGIRSYNGFTFIFGNLNSEGRCCVSVSPAFGNILLSNNDPRTWYDAYIFQLEKPYRSAGERVFAWGGGITYTLADAEQLGGDLFSLDRPTVKDYPRTGTDRNQKHTIVGNFIMNLPWIWGTQFSGIVNLGSGDKFFVNNCTNEAVNNRCEPLRGTGEIDDKWKSSFLGIGDWAYNVTDLRLAKFFPPVAGTRIGVTADLFNAFNVVNYSGFDGFIPRAGQAPNANFGVPGSLSTDGRRFQLGVQVDW